jgi:recombination protein RecA
LDITLGIGGIPRGEFIEITGGVSSGKTTLCQHIVAEAQKTRGACAWIDVDHSFDPDYALVCGINPDLLYISEPQTAEQALEILENLAGTGGLSVVVLDSVTNLISQSELKSVLSDSSQASIDPQLSRSLRKLDAVIHQNGTAIIFTDHAMRGISHVYYNLAQNLPRLALKLHAGVRLELNSIQLLLENGITIGNKIEVRVIKNHFSPCLHRTGFDIIYNNGINRAGEIFDLGIQLRIICKLEQDYFFENHKLGATHSDALLFLKQNLPIAEEIEQIIRLKMLPDIYPAAT